MLGLLSRELIFGGASYWREFFVSKWVVLDNKKHEGNSLKQLTLTVLFFIGRIFASEIRGVIVGGGGRLNIGILRCYRCNYFRSASPSSTVPGVLLKPCLSVEIPGEESGGKWCLKH